MRFVLLLLLVLVVGGVLAAPGVVDRIDREIAERRPGGDAGTGTEPQPERPGEGRERRSERRSIPRARCPEDAPAGCRSVTGRIVFVESVDPDGDGDLHLVIAGGNVTGAGLTALDISKDLRPARDPRVGQTVSAAGPVYRGSFRQRQIGVLELVLPSGRRLREG